MASFVAMCFGADEAFGLDVFCAEYSAVLVEKRHEMTVSV